MARVKSTKKTPQPLTPKQLRVLTFVRDYTHTHGYAPTMQELGDEFGVSKVTMFEHITALQKKGYLRRSKHKARSLRLKDTIEFADERSTRLPLAGTIAAGLPIEAVEEREYVDLEEMFVSPYGNFVLRVKGDSMIGDSIADGDFVICEKRETARDGETVVALIDGEEATLKRIFQTPQGVRLEASNPAYKPIISKSVQVQGVVIGVLRRF
jgi:repressor LexA